MCVDKYRQSGGVATRVDETRQARGATGVDGQGVDKARPGHSGGDDVHGCGRPDTSIRAMKKQWSVEATTSFFSP